MSLLQIFAALGRQDSHLNWLSLYRVNGVGWYRIVNQSLTSSASFFSSDWSVISIWINKDKYERMPGFFAVSMEISNIFELPYEIHFYYFLLSFIRLAELVVSTSTDQAELNQFSLGSPPSLVCSTWSHCFFRKSLRCVSEARQFWGLYQETNWFSRFCQGAQSCIIWWPHRRDKSLSRWKEGICKKKSCTLS